MTTGSDGVNWTLITNGNWDHNYGQSYFGSHEFTPRLTAWGSIQPSPHRRIFFHNNPGENYTMVWWGWMVTNFTGTMYFANVTDDDFDLWIHPTDYNRPDTEGATRVINGNNWQPWHYGSYDVTKGTVYHTKMYMGEGGGGDDSVFYWNTTGPASAAGFGHSGGNNREQWPGTTGTMENFSYLDGTVEDTGKSGNSSWPTSGIPGLPGGDLPNAGDDPTDGDFALWFTTREKAEAYLASLSGGGGGDASVIANPLTSIDRNYNSNWVISVDKWDSYRSIGYRGKVDVEPIQSASVIAGGGGFDGSFNVTDASFRTQGDASSNWFSSSHPAQMAFNNDISFIGGQYFSVENVTAYQNGSIVSDSDNSAIKLDFLFPYPRTATEYKILPPNEISNNNALYMPNRWCIYGSNSETIDTTLPSTESNGYFLLDSRADAKPWSAHDASLISVSGGKKYIIANPGLYRQYRMSILQNSGDPSGNINIGELIYYEGGVGPIVGDGALDGRSDLSGGLAFHGDVSGINGFEPMIINNYTVDVSLNRFTLNGDLQPELTLYRGETYNFNQSDIDNSGQRLFVSNDSDGRIVDNNTSNVKLAGAGGIYTTGGSKHSTTPATFQLNSNANINNNIHGSANASYSFDNNVTNTNMTMSSAPSNHIINNSSNIEFGIIIIFPTPVIVNKYKMWSRRHNSGGSIYDARPRAWTLRATNNINSYVLNTSSSYTELDNVSNVQHAEWPLPDDNSLTNDDKYVEYSFTNTNAYSVYILNFTECNRADYIAVSEIAYYGIDGTTIVTNSGGLSDNSAGFITTGTLGTDLSSSWTIPIDAPDTMYYASDGSANAGGIINIANIPNYNIVNLFDGNNNSLYKSPIGAFENYDLSAGKEFAVKFELPSKKKILKYDIKNTNIKSWTLRGCDNSAIYDRNDSNTYELLHGVSDLISPLISDEQTLAGGGALNGTGGDQGLAVDTLYPGNNPTPSTVLTAEKAFNGYDSTPNNQNFWNANNYTSNNELRFKFPYRVNITRYKLWVRQIAGHPENWEIRGAPKASSYDMNNSSTYDVLDEQTGITGWQVKPAGAIAADTHRKEFIISNTSPFYSNFYEEIIIYLYSSWNEIEELVYIGRKATDITQRSNIVSNPKNYTYYVLDVSSSNITDSAELGELIYYDTGSYPSAGAGSLDGSSGDVGGLQLHGDVKGAGGKSEWTALSGGLGAHGDISGILGHSDGSFVSNVYDGSNITVYKSPIGAFDNYDLSAGKEFAVKMDFPSSKKILRYDLNNINLKSWTLRGTDNSLNYDRTDSNTYEVLDSNVDFSYVVGSGISNHSNDSIPSSLPSSPNNVSKPEGTWLRVRHMHTGATTGYDTNTNLDGTWEYNHTTMNDNEIWAIKFDHLEFDQFLFFADNYQRWMIIEKDELFKEPNNGSFTVLQSSYSNSSYISNFYNRGTPPGQSPGYDPLVCITNWTTDDCLYIEDNYSNINQQEMIARPWDIYIRLSELSPGGTGGGSTVRIISNPKDYTYYVLDSSASNDISSAEIGELIVYDSRVKLSNSTSVFNGTLRDASDAFISDSGVFSNNSLTSGSEFSVKFEFPTKKYITSYRIWPQIDGSMNSPSDWYLYGCDVSSLYDRTDESTYSVLDVRTEENSWSTTNSTSIRDLSGYNEYTIINPGNYSYYVLDVSGSNNVSLCSIGEIAYYESERVDVTTVREPQPYENHQLTINMGASEETSDWEVGEIIVFNKKLTSEEEESVVSYLENTFYGSDGFDPVGNNSTLRLTRNNLRLPEVYSAMDPSSREIEYFNQAHYNRVVNMNLASINYQDISSIPIKTSDLRNRALTTDVSFRTITGVSKGYTPSSIVKLSDFRGASSGGGSGDGGTLTNFDGYNIHSFTTVGTDTFTVTGSITVEFLIVGGGGGGGMDMGGGGGGGGVVKGIDYILDSGEYIITVGDGGMGAPKGSNDAYPIGQGRTSHQYAHNGKNGDDSSIVGGTVNFIGKGGGYGGSSYRGHTLGSKPNSGGSGGGGSGYNNSGQLIPATGSAEHQSTQDTYSNIDGVTGYGHPGGQSSGSSWYGSGGGGAGGTGFKAVGTSVYPEGGPGIESDILGTSYYWGGGGGGSGYSQNGGNGGVGGGGGGAVGTTTGGSGLNPGSPGGGGSRNSQTNTPGGNAGANTGGGGGGGSHYRYSNQGGNGGSGIVVIRYK